MKHFLLLPFIVCAAGTSLLQAAEPVPIPIANASFEDQAIGDGEVGHNWHQTGSGWAVFTYPVENLNPSATDGVNAAYTNTRETMLVQQLKDFVIRPGSYRFRFDLGHNASAEVGFVGVRMEIAAVDQTGELIGALAEGKFSEPPKPGAWSQDCEVTFDVGPDDAAVGGIISIGFQALEDRPQAVIDHVSGEFMPLPPPGPETAFFVSPKGSDTWSGRMPDPAADGNDGPFATVAKAQGAVREMKKSGPLAGPVRVFLRGGTYELPEPLVFGPEDSGQPGCPVVYAAYQNEKPVLSGGRRLTGFKKTAAGRYRLEISGAKNGGWPLRQLFVNGERWQLARSPNQGFFYWLGKEATPANENVRFRFRPQDLAAFDAPAGGNVIVYHGFETTLLKPVSFDREKGLAEMPMTAWPYGDVTRERFIFENHAQALDAPGEFFLDAATGALEFIAPEDFDINAAEVVAPRLSALVKLSGQPGERSYVHDLGFEGISFEYCEWPMSGPGHGDAQAAVTVDAAVTGIGARRCFFERCEFARLGGYGLWLENGCTGNRIEQNEFHDLGAGGIRIGDLVPREGPLATGHNRIHNNLVRDGGKVHASAVGILICQSSDNTVTHNEVADMNYTGISVGWAWGFGPHTGRRNLIEKNYIHDIGRGMLADLGGIYTLGVAHGTVLRNNLIHDVWSYPQPGVGAGGIYLDEGTSGVLVENNVVIGTHSGGLTVNYGSENTIRNNIFAFGKDLQIARGASLPKNDFLFENNIVFYDLGNLFGGGGILTTRRNTYFRQGGLPIIFQEGGSLENWQKFGNDEGSIIADPKFLAPEKKNFSLPAGSPVWKNGFKPIDVSDAGLTGDARWKARSRDRRNEPFRVPGRGAFDHDFENENAGAMVKDARLWGESGPAGIRITDQIAKSGTRSLKFQDAAGLESPFSPYLWFNPLVTEGKVRVSFDMNIEPGARPWVEWRTQFTEKSPDYVAGPAFGLEDDGRLMVGGKELLRVPANEWVHFESEYTLGGKATGRWTLRVRLPDGKSKEFRDLPCSPDFHRLEWLGFMANSQADVAFFIDNLRLEISKK